MQPTKISPTEFAKIMAILAAGCGKEPSDVQQEVYYAHLADLPLDVLRLAASRAVLENKYPTIPIVGAVRALAVEIMTPRLPSASEALEEARRAVRCHADRAEGLAMLSPFLRRVVEVFGWSNLANSTNAAATQAHFAKTYEWAVAQATRWALLPPAHATEFKRIQAENHRRVTTMPAALLSRSLSLDATDAAAGSEGIE